MDWIDRLDLKDFKSEFRVDRSFPAFLSRNNKDVASFKVISSLKQEAEDIGLTGKDVAKYVARQQTLDRERRRCNHKQMSSWQAPSRSRPSRSRREKRANEIQIQMAQIEAEQAKDQAKIQADKEVALNELELQAPAQAQTISSAAAAPPPTNMSPEATLLYRPEG